MNRVRKALGIGTLLVTSGLAAAEGPQLSLRHLHNVSHFQDVRQQALELRLPGWDRLHVANRVFTMDWVVAAGALHWDEGQSHFVSLGRGIRWHNPGGLARTQLQFSLSPTWVQQTLLAGRELGGHFHFTTAVAWLVKLDAAGRQTLALRLQHTSNAGSQSENPGLDLAGLEFGWHFGNSAPFRIPPRAPTAVTLDFRAPAHDPLRLYPPQS